MNLAENNLQDMNTDEATDQFLTFTLAGEEYGVDILGVQEVKVWSGVTTLPNTPSYIKGVLNLRGVIVQSLIYAYDLVSIPVTMARPR